MSKTISLIHRVQIASPCTADWNAMAGDERVRFCGQCRLNVYNLSEMSEREAEMLIIEKEGKLCARIYRRRDGTILTRDCPNGLARVRQTVRNHAVRVAAALAFIASAVAYAVVQDERRSGPIVRYPEVKPTMYSKARSALNRWLVVPDWYGQGWSGGIVILNPPPQQTQVSPIAPGSRALTGDSPQEAGTIESR